jgi:hypothetical protein
MRMRRKRLRTSDIAKRKEIVFNPDLDFYYQATTKPKLRKLKREGKLPYKKPIIKNHYFPFPNARIYISKLSRTNRSYIQPSPDQLQKNHKKNFSYSYKEQKFPLTNFNQNKNPLEKYKKVSDTSLTSTSSRALIQVEPGSKIDKRIIQKRENLKKFITTLKENAKYLEQSRTEFLNNKQKMPKKFEKIFLSKNRKLSLPAQPNSAKACYNSRKHSINFKIRAECKFKAALPKIQRKNFEDKIEKKEKEMEEKLKKFLETQNEVNNELVGELREEKKGGWSEKIERKNYREKYEGEIVGSLRENWIESQFCKSMKKKEMEEKEKRHDWRNRLEMFKRKKMQRKKLKSMLRQIYQDLDFVKIEELNFKASNPKTK